MAELAALDNNEKKLAEQYKILDKKLPSFYGGPTPYFLSRLFISYVAAYEIFLQETAAMVVSKNPQKVGSTTFKLSEIIAADGLDQLVQRATDDFLNGLMYEKPAAYLDKFCTVISIDPKPLKTMWAVFVEAKARRDLGVHNAWKCNSTYLRKLKEIDYSTASIVGELLTPTSSDYIDTVTEALNYLAATICAQTLSVHWPEVDPNALDFEIDA